MTIFLIGFWTSWQNYSMDLRLQKCPWQSYNSSSEKHKIIDKLPVLTKFLSPICTTCFKLMMPALQLVMWLPLSRISRKKFPGKLLRFTGKSRENWFFFWFHSKQYMKRLDMNYYTVTLTSLTFQFIAILFQFLFRFWCCILVEINCFTTEPEINLIFLPNLVNQIFLGIFFVKNPDSTNPKENQT